MHVRNWLPILQWLPKYSRADLKGDLPAGLTVGVMLIPQGMAYAMIAGLPVVYGLYAALVPLVVYTLMGSSKQLAIGPVAMDSLLVAAGLTGLAVAGSERYIELALLLALMTGVLQLILGTLRMGFLANFLSKPVISGFTSAAALIIGLNQLPNLLGINMSRSAHLHVLLQGAWTSVPELHWPTLLMSVASIVLLLALRKWAPKMPGALAVVALGIVAVTCGGLDLNTVGSVPSGLPEFQLPGLSWQDVNMLLPIAGTLGLIAFIESFSIAKAVTDPTSHTHLDANQELRALGTANTLGAMFGAFPIAAGFSRTAVNVRAGSRTPLSGLIAAGVVALALTFLMPAFRPLPNAVLGAIIAVAVSGLFNFGYFRKLWLTHRAEAVLLAVTFLLTAFAGMVVGMASGMILSLTLTLYRTSLPHTAELGQVSGVYRNLDRFPNAKTTPNVVVLRFDGPLNYASQSHFKDFVLTRLASRQDQDETVHRMILSAESIPHLDATASAMLEDLLDQLESKNVALHIAGAIGPVRDAMARAGLMERIGPAHFHTGLASAMGHIEPNAHRKNVATQTSNANNP